MALYPVTFILLTAAIQNALTSTPYPVITIGVVLDKGMDKAKVSDAVNQAAGSFLQMYPDTPVLTFKWITLEFTRPGSDVVSLSKVLQENITALVTTLRCPQRRMVSAMTEAFQIPHLSVDLGPCPSIISEKFTLHLTLQNNNMAAVLVDLVKAAKRKYIYLKFGNRVALRVRQQWLLELSSAGIHAVLIDSADNATLWKSTGNDTLVTAAMSRQEAGDNGLDADNPMMVISLLDTLPNSSLMKACRYSNCILAKSRMTQTCSDTNLPITTSNGHLTVSESQLTRATFVLYMAFSVLSNEGTRRKTSEYSVYEPQDLLEGLGVLEALKLVCSMTNPCLCQAETTEYNLYSVPVGLRTEITPMCNWTEITPIGNWTEIKGLTVNWAWPQVNRLFPSKLTDFGGVNLRIAVEAESHPYVNRSESGNNSYHGMMVDMLEDLAKKLNFRYTFVEAEDGFYGAKRADGTWSGMIGLVTRGEADVGAAPFTVTKERSEAVDFTAPFQQESLSIMTATPKQTSSQFQFLKPFNIDVWLSLIAALLIASVGLAFISLKSPTQIQHEVKNPHVELERSVPENIFLIISSYFEQGPTFYPTSVSGRCLLSFWFVFTILIMAMYTAHLAAVLTVSTPVRPINSLQDLADQSDLPVYCLTGTNTYTVLTQSERPLYKIIAGRLKTISSVTELLDGVRDGKYATIGDRASMAYKAARACGAMRVAEERFYGFSLAFITTKNSPYNEAISINIQKMFQSGLIQKLERKWFNSFQYCPPEEVKVHRLGLDRLDGVFIVYGSIACTAVLACLLKTYQNRCRRWITLLDETRG